MMFLNTGQIKSFIYRGLPKPQLLVLVFAGMLLTSCGTKMGDFGEVTPIHSFGSKAPLMITSVSPAFGLIAGGTSIVISGSGFSANASVAVGGSPCVISAITSTRITCTTSAHTTDAADIVVTGIDGRVSKLERAYTFVSSYATVVSRKLFFNNSSWDGEDSGATIEDDNAISPNKEALLPGQTATFANYTGYVRGINGIMIDVANLGDPSKITENDFVFMIGNDANPSGWEVAPAPSDMTIRSGDGLNGSDRITFVWDDYSNSNRWLQVTFVSSLNSRLQSSDIFYFGNARGETGNSPTDAIVDGEDIDGARNNQRTFFDPAEIDFPYDFNKDQRVSATELLIARNNPTTAETALKLLTFPK